MASAAPGSIEPHRAEIRGGMRIAIVGAGALGGFVGARLAQSGQPTVLIDNNIQRVDAINELGLRLEWDNGEAQVPVPASLAADLADPFDLLIVLTKGGHTEAAIADCRHLLGPSTYVLTFQNGLGNADMIARHVNPERIAVGMTNWAADSVGPAHVRIIGRGEIRIWHARGRDEPAVRAIADVLDRADLSGVADPSVESAIWEKVAFNAAMNPIAAITGLTVGEIGDDPDGRSLADDVVGEVLALARAKGLAVDYARVSAMLAHAFRSHRSHRPSMLQDVLAGRPTEIESINGAVIQEAVRLGQSAPVTEALLRLVRLRGQSREQSPSSEA